ncbi:helix-turn-helix domain-containing protein [Chelativorans sp. ZYF759]|uniref:IclR family transcriptional regulator n=1 Tax=Chelativorans sp. ZYF759 TaxID=2692213 RepID=UPI00145D675D|nr:IclR family transcriptional regulator [Chelativorans sp. ZYF759]NMG41817.1 helix-turn-helix domain-containing protein [Chelativorans sp. ZYF759]
MSSMVMGAESTDAKTKERTGVQSLERAFKLLETVASHPQGISLADLSKSVGLHNSTTFHLIRTMVSLGYVRQSPDTKKYHVGSMIFGLAAASRSESEMVALAMPILEELAELSGESSHLAIMTGNEIVIAGRVSGSGVFQMQERTGGVRPGHATALGKVLLAPLAMAQVDRYFEANPPTPLTAKTIVDPQRIREELRQTLSAGLAYDDGEFNDEARCVAAPVKDFTGQTIAAIGISAPIWRLTLQSLQEKSSLVLKASVKLSAELGGAP